ncbi:hypothetical protein [Erwinia pyrifoliae]|uniref:Uncharacterized protein n=1 Tax=Erwinia pyrifoliae TaxID=79967 RepID=A0ABY5XAP2_ERWPY|nr:hypothetical protein [Erwinia pyrifoliae]MCT2386185.1 hypothetical protein [Erwinia pyrifoliae]MCU8588218.1 hypothetical protein [Erwinia pyrifoliae]UWS34190.1 hypothetical protein NYP84_03035 [Erwinia pyrifoliae]
MALHYKKAKGWREVRPQDDIQKGEWWAVYRDATLSGLLRQVHISSQNVALGGSWGSEWKRIS